MSKYIPKDQFSQIVVRDNVTPQSGFEPEPKVYFPINVRTEGLDAIKIDGTQLSGTWVNEDTGYTDWGMGRWGSTASGSINMHGQSIYYTRFANIVSGTGDVNTGAGTVCLWYTPEFDSGDLSENKYLIESTYFLKFYFDYSTSRFIGDFFDGSSWGTRVVSGSAMVLTSGTSIHVGLGYNNEQGALIFLSGTIEGSLLNTWIQQPLPEVMSIGCISGTDGLKADGYLDDIRWYDKILTSSNMVKLVNNNYDSN